MSEPDLRTLALRRALSRREFLGLARAAAGAILLGGCAARRGDAAVRLAAYPFSLGVASGDPTPTGVVLWTRLAPDPLAGGGMPAARVPVGWEIAHDEGFRRVAARGEALAVPELAHSVHVEAEGLEPGRTYWYRFHYAGDASPVARTRTAPAPGSSPERLAFAFVSCQKYDQGYYTAHRHLAEEEVDLVLHLGDYIYESQTSEGVVRPHGTGEPVSLEEYRNRYALYKADPDLQAAHAAHPFVVSWDDHEVDNNYAGAHDQDGSPEEVFLRRRAAAYQAYYEHLPLRRASLPRGPDLRLFRRLSYGDLARFHVLDTRQHRSDQVCGDGTRPVCPEADDPARTMLGAEQEAWLREGLLDSPARWNVLANQVPFARVLRPRPDGERGYYLDGWDGYAHSRDRLVDLLASGRVSDPVVLTGDVHVSWVADVKADGRDPASRTVATELVGTSVSSGGDGAELPGWGRALLADNPHLRYFNGQRGYVRCSLTPGLWTSDYRVVDRVSEPGAPVRTHASFAVEAGRPGAVPA